MVFLAVMALLCFLISDLIAALFGLKQVKRSLLHRGRLLSEVADLQRQAARLSSPATFAQAAKLQRLAIAKEKEAELLQQRQEQYSGRWLNRVQTALKLVLTVALTVHYWRQPAAFIHPNVMWPLDRWLVAPHAGKLLGTGAVTILPWLTLSKRASSAISSAIVGS